MRQICRFLSVWPFRVFKDNLISTQVPIKLKTKFGHIKSVHLYIQVLVVCSCSCCWMLQIIDVCRPNFWQDRTNQKWIAAVEHWVVHFFDSSQLFWAVKSIYFESFFTMDDGCLLSSFESDGKFLLPKYLSGSSCLSFFCLPKSITYPNVNKTKVSKHQ